MLTHQKTPFLESEKGRSLGHRTAANLTVVLALGVDETSLRSLGLTGNNVIRLATADDVADWLWVDGDDVSEILIGSSPIDKDLDEILRRDWADIKVRLL